MDAPRKLVPFRLSEAKCRVIASARGGVLKASDAVRGDFVLQGTFADGQSGGAVLDTDSRLIGMLRAVDKADNATRAYIIAACDIRAFLEGGK